MKPLTAGLRMILITAALFMILQSVSCNTTLSSSSSLGPAVTAVTLSGMYCKATNYDSYGTIIEYNIEISLSNYLSNNVPYEFAVGVSPADADRSIMYATDLNPSVCEISLNADKTKLVLVPKQFNQLLLPSIRSGTYALNFTVFIAQ